MTGKNRTGIGLAVLGAGIVCICGILAAGKRGNRDAVPGQAVSGTAYVPEFLSCSLPCTDVSRICGNGEGFFLAGGVEEERQITEGEDTFTVHEYRTGIFRMSMDGTSIAELEYYRPSWEGESDEGNVYVESLAVDGEGRLWVTEQASRNQYELPEDFDETFDAKWDYLTGTENSYVFRQLDSQGRELRRIETGSLEERTGFEYINGVVSGQDGSIYILAGNIPDILDTGNLPMRQYIQKGLLEDLWPFIEGDRELGREALMERVLQAAEAGGKLYRIFDSFSINTVVGARKTVGTSESWGLGDLLAALDTMGDGCQIFGENDTKQDILHRILTQNLESYIDWTSGAGGCPGVFRTFERL